MRVIFCKKSCFSRGSILVESLVAISVTSIGLIGVMNLLSFSFRTNADVQQDLVATYLAAEGIEVVKNIIDTAYVDIGAAIRGGGTRPAWNRDVASGNYEASYDSLSLIPIGSGSLSERPLFYKSSTGSYFYDVAQTTDGNFETPFKRTLILELKNNIDCDTNRDDVVRVLSKVTWVTPKGDVREVQLEDHFFDWREESEIPTSRKPKTCPGV